MLTNAFLYGAGLVFLVLAKAQHMLRGYKSPKPIPIEESERCVDYDVEVVEAWLRHLADYTGSTDTLRGRSVLELGPGSDLGIGLYLLARGAGRYSACDVNELAARVPPAFYASLFRRLEGLSGADLAEAARADLAALQAGRPDRLNYLVRNDFDIVAAVGERSVDLVVSQAAFEHFDDIRTTVAGMTRACKPGAIAVLEIDLQTHSRWIRDKDPNNIYRYPEFLMSLFWFRGIPNRVRPQEYARALRDCGWQDIRVVPQSVLGKEHWGRSGWARRFRTPDSEMETLTVLICATLPG